MVAALSFQYTFPFVGPQAKIQRSKRRLSNLRKGVLSPKAPCGTSKGFHYINIYSIIERISDEVVGDGCLRDGLTKLAVRMEVGNDA